MQFYLQVQDVEEKTKSRCERCFQEVMQETSEKVKSYYLNCIYQILHHTNIRSPEDQTNPINAISHDFTIKSHDPEPKYYPLLSGRSDRSSTQRKTTGSTYNQESLRKTPKKDSTILATVPNVYTEPDTSRKFDMSKKPVLSRKTISQSYLASGRLSAPRNIDIRSSSSIRKAGIEGGGGIEAERLSRKKVDEKGAQHKTFSRAVRTCPTSKFLPSTKLILHHTSPETSHSANSLHAPVCSAQSQSPPKGVYWKNCRDKKLV